MGVARACRRIAAATAGRTWVSAPPGPEGTFEPVVFDEKGEIKKKKELFLLYTKTQPRTFFAYGAREIARVLALGTLARYHGCFMHRTDTTAAAARARCHHHPGSLLLLLRLLLLPLLLARELAVPAGSARRRNCMHNTQNTAGTSERSGTHGSQYISAAV